MLEPTEDTLYGDVPLVDTERVDYHVVATHSRADERTRVLMHGDTFGVFDHHGDIEPGGLGEQGVYHDGTRHLSALRLELAGRKPFFLGSPVRDENDQLTVAMTNPDLVKGGRIVLALGTLEIARRIVLVDGVCYHQVEVANHGLERAEVSIALIFAADYADIFEVRGMQRLHRGVDLEPEVAADRVVLAYRGLDDVVRRTVLAFSPEPVAISANRAKMAVRLEPRQSAAYRVAVACERGPVAVPILAFEEAQRRSRAHVARDNAWSTRITTSNAEYNAWIDRTVSDLRLLTSELPTGPYPYAGVPWFNTPFGRDGIVTALECLWVRPSLARGVLTYLASTQATEVIDDEDAEPGKILHEIRKGEMAALKEMPFGRYFGSADATPLFVLLAGEYYQRTGDVELVEGLWPHLEAALRWVDRFGDADGDGFVEYSRRRPTGLLHQGWKDSDEAVFHADGSLAVGPIALCEVQALVYAAKRAGAALADVVGDRDLGDQLAVEAETLKKRFDHLFWSDELAAYALALDGMKRPCLVRTSNAGHCLFTRIAPPERARHLAKTLLSPEFFSGWGIRTVASSEVRYNPMAYHNGSVWPHDNALVAWGLSRYGFGDLALQILSAQFEAAKYFDLHRMPELFCGFAQEPGEGPVLYPVACAPQAWAAASALLLLQACLGLEIDGPRGRVCFTRPVLPEWLDEVRISDLEVGEARLDLRLRRYERDVGVDVLSRDGDVQVMVVK